jgi:hypothetical protein
MATAAIGTPVQPSVELLKMLSDVAAVRSLPAPASIGVSVVARTDVPRLLDQLLSDDDRRWFAQLTTLYRLLGHLRPDEDYATVYKSLASQAGVGFYSPEQKRLWLVSDGGGFDFASLPRESKVALAHELTHAVQDANFPLGSLLKTTAGDLDANLALTCLLEGDAVTNAEAYAAKYLLAPPFGTTTVVLASAAAQADVPPSISRELLFPYTTGADWIRSIRGTGGTAAVDALFGQPSRSTAFVLHPERTAAGWQPRAVALPDIASPLGVGWKHESGGTFGEFQLRNFLQLRLPGLPAATSASGWAGDRYDVYTNGTGAVAVFRLTFEDASKAAAFRAAREAFYQAANAARSTRGATALTEVAGVTAAWQVESDEEAVFVLATSADLATRALQLVAGG